MTRIWAFVASYPSSSTPYTRRRIPQPVIDDLKWWNALLPTFNGILFFDDPKRETVQVYTDASSQGMGGFFYANGTLLWKDAVHLILQENSFSTAFDEHRAHINVLEVLAILRAFQTWSSSWSGKRVITYTDSSTAWTGLLKNTLHGPANEPLRTIFLLAAEKDIILEPRWLQSEENALADALSRFNTNAIANICPHWQI